jgi:putative nucleotidyltransferase with HDIG domain
MHKKVSIDQLKPGLYIHDLDCGWMEHPFLHNQFLIQDLSDIDKIIKTGIKSLYIDTHKGMDVDDAPTLQEAKAETHAQLHKVAMEDQAAIPQHLELAKEKSAARRIAREANQVVTGMMADIRLGKQVELERVNPVVVEMTASIFRNQDALSGLTRIRNVDHYTFEHSVSVTVLMVSFARTLGLPMEEIHEIGTGALLHDIGKSTTPLTILNKPGKLTEDEFVIMRDHVVQSERLLQAQKGISEIAISVAAEHHERYDGTGYPYKKKGDEISFHGQMAAIVDVYDALTAARVYKPGMDPNEVLGKLLTWSEQHFNPELVRQFIRCVGIYPVGTCVELESGNIAVVTEIGERNMLKPLVLVFFSKRWRKYIEPYPLDLSDQKGPGTDRILQSVDPAVLSADVADYL